MKAARFVVLGCAVALTAAACGSSTASQESQTPQGAGSTMPAPEPGVCQGCQPPLTYHGGPVLDTNDLTIVPIYWAPDGYSFPQTYSTVVNQYLADVAAASGQTDNTYAVSNEYYQMTNGGKSNIAYKITAGTPITTNDGFPQTSNPCSPNPPFNACVNSDQIQSELSSLLSSNNLPADMSHLYAVFFPDGVQTFEGNARSIESYCGIHQSFSPSGGGTVLYADEPYLNANGCNSGQAPNGDPFADAEVGVLSHEIIETMTDPLSNQPSWFDNAGNEIGDECNFNFGPPVGSTDPNNPQATEYNQVINGHDYYTQTMFSNAAFTNNGSGNGCITGETATTTAFTAVTPTEHTATMDMSDTKVDADGSSTVTATLTVLDSSGEPVSGDHVHFDVQADDTTPGECGKLAPADAVTDANGRAATTYASSTANIACIVFGLDAESGQSDWGTVYQGTSSSMEPGITDASAPSSITAGGGMETFTVTASNPSSNDIKDARFDIFLSGDSTGNSGINASQVHISYADDATGGSFKDLAPSGETTQDGEIDAYAMPDSASDLAAGGSATVKFQISLDAGAPTSAATGSALHIEVDLDQVDPADGSTNNLDYVVLTDVTVNG